MNNQTFFKSIDLKRLKKGILFISCFFIFAFVGKSQVVVTTTVTWTTGWCNICGPTVGNYACNPPWSGSGTWNNGIRTFTLPVPPGNIITGACVVVNKVNCGYTNLCVLINGQNVGCAPPTPPGNCSCGACWPQTFCNTWSCPTGLPGFINGGTNTLQLVVTPTNQPICVNNAIITLTYQTCCPTPTIIPSGNTVICAGQSTTLNATGAGAGGTYTWVAPGGNTVSTQASAVVSPTATTIYTAVGTTTFPCTGSQTIQVEVNPNPTVVPSNNSPICQGGTISLACAPVIAGTLTTYSWAGPGGYTSLFQNPMLSPAQPSNSGIYVCTVANTFTNGGTCSASAATTVNVVPVNQVTVTPNFTLCQGENLNLTAINAVPPTSYLWSGPNTFTSNLANPTIINMNPALHQGDYLVTASFAVPGITLVCTSTAVTNVSVVATSQVTMTVPQNICQHATAVLTATSNPLALDFTWNGPNGFTANGTNTTIVDIDPLYTGVYNVVATWAIGTKSCMINQNSVINVVPVAPIAINDSIKVCYPANVQLTANSPGAISYSWIATTGFTSLLPNPLLGSPGTTATGVYTVTTAYTNGALICYNSNTTHVTVNPVLPFTLEPYRQMCFNSTYTISGPNGGTSYEWIGPNGVVSNNQILAIPSIQPPLAGTYTLHVMLGPCMTGATTKVDVLSPISFSLTPGNKIICKGDQVKLTVGAKDGSHNYAYVWNPSQWIASPTGSTNTGFPEGTTIYNVTAYDIACPFYTISTSFEVKVNRAPIPQLELESYEGCQPLCLKYNSKTQNDATMVTYDFGNGAVLQNDDFTYCLDRPGTYNMKIQTKGKNGCVETFDLPAPVVVHPIPMSDFTTDPNEITTTQNVATFIPSSQYGPVLGYYWMFSGAKSSPKNGYDTSGFKNPVRVFDVVGKFSTVLISTTDKGCKDTVIKVIEINDEFNIFIPNTFTPNGDGLNDVFNVKGAGLKMEGYEMQIYDRWGTLVYTTKDALKGWDGTVKGLNAENGVYVFKVKALGANGEGKKEYVGHVTLLK